MIDFHSHVLPGIDDGSRNVETSLKMLQKSAEQGVSVMAATPHFYADEMSVDGFLENRQRAYEKLLESGIEGRAPELLLGAEVAFFSGMAQAGRLGELTYKEGDVLLLEMPFRPWSRRDAEEVVSLIKDRGFTVILAHLERFMTRDNRRFIEKLLAAGAIAQINAESIEHRRGRQKLVEMFKAGSVKFLGSDCHGMHRRPPNMDVGIRALTEELGEDLKNKFIAENHRFYEEEICKRKCA